MASTPAPRSAATSVPVIGLTGGIASGKSTVSALLAQRGAHIIDADSAGHRVLTPQGEAYPDVVAAFGTDILADDGTIDRKALGAIVFADPARLRQLNGISHPHMAEHMARDIAAVRRRTGADAPPAIVLDAAILFEAGWDALCDRVWAVQTEAHTAIERLVERNAMTREQAQARLDAQWSNAQRADRAAQVIRNDGTLAELEAAVERAWDATLGAG